MRGEVKSFFYPSPLKSQSQARDPNHVFEANISVEKINTCSVDKSNFDIR